MRKKQILLVALAMMLVLPSFLVNADTKIDESENEKTVNIDGELASKDEVVYANLKANGQLKEIYVVNTLDVRKAGKIRDYGTFSLVKNLTDLSEIKQNGNSVLIDAPEGTFYYQGNMDKQEIPWNVEVSYSLDGKEVGPEDIAGKDGHVEISIATSKNQNADPVFYENYLLQVSLTLPDTFSHIETDKGMVANAGKNKQITFTVMPGEDEVLSVEADVVNFEFDGIQIAAVPSSLPIDTGEIGNMTEDMATLADAIAEINKGVGELEKGVSDLNDGVASLRDGSKEYKNGIARLDEGSTDLVNGSKSISDALTMISNSLAGSEDMDLTQLTTLPTILSEMGNQLLEISGGLSTLHDGYKKSYGYLVNAINDIPVYQLTEEQIAPLYGSDKEQNALIDKLLETYEAAQIVVGTYANVKEGLDAVEPTLNDVSGGLWEIGTGLTTLAEQLETSLEDFDTESLGELQKGLKTLSAQYGEFHLGLRGYTDGVGQLANSYNELHSGIEGVADGTNELESGVSELHDGTNELHEETSDLPEQMQDEVDKMIGEYDKSDFKPVSFVSSNNEKINSVQFVIKTASIEVDEIEKDQSEEAPVQQKKGFWTLLKELFQRG